MPIDPNIPLQARVGTPPDIMGFLSDMDAMEERKATRKLRTREEKYRQTLGNLMSQHGGNLRKVSQDLQSEFPMKAMGLMSMANTQDELLAKRKQEQLVYQQQQQKMKRNLMGKISKKYLAQDSEGKIRNFPALRRTMKDYGIPENPAWGDKTEYDQDVEFDLGMAVGMDPSLAKQGTDYDRKLQYEKALQDVKSGAEPTTYQKAMMEQMGWRKEISEDKKSQAWVKINQAGEKIEIAKEELGIKKGDAVIREDKAEASKRKNLEAHKAMMMKKSSQIKEVEQFAKDAISISKNPALAYATGAKRLQGRELVWGSKTKDVVVDLEKLIAQGAIQTMAKLKAESPTGSTGFGALSEKELKTLQDSFAALKDRGQSYDRMVRELNTVNRIMTDYVKRIRKFEGITEIGSPVKKSSSESTAINSGKKGLSKEDDDLLNEYGVK